MKKVFIHIGTAAIVELKKGDYLTPIILDKVDGKIRASLGKPVMAWDKVCNGETLFLLNDLYPGRCSFFCVNQDYDHGYNPRYISKIELI